MNDINKRFANFRNGCEDAPRGLFQRERIMREYVGQAVDALRAHAVSIGLSPCNSDGAHNVEATIYEWLTKDSTFGATVEGVGQFGVGTLKPICDSDNPNRMCPDCDCWKATRAACS